MPLTENAVKHAEPKEKDYKLAHEKGLFLLVTRAGGKLWRLAYRFEGKQKLLALGQWPEINLEEARERRDSARKLLAHGIDPSEARKEEKAAMEAAERERQENPTRFMLDDSGALSLRLGKHSLHLTAKETAALRIFLEATKAVRIEEATPCH